MLDEAKAAEVESEVKEEVTQPEEEKATEKEAEEANQAEEPSQEDLTKAAEEAEVAAAEAATKAAEAAAKAEEAERNATIIMEEEAKVEAEKRFQAKAQAVMSSLHLTAAGGSKFADGETQLVVNGEPSQKFQCSEGSRAVDEEQFGFRQLTLSLSSDGGLFESLAPIFQPLAEAITGKAEDAEDEEDVSEMVYATAQSVTVIEDSGTKFKTPSLSVALEPMLLDNRTMKVKPETTGSDELDSFSKMLTVVYACSRDSRATVQLKMDIRIGERDIGEFCVQWVKVCKMGFASLDIKSDSLQAVSNGVVTVPWQTKMISEGTTERWTHFSLSSKGSFKLQPPKVWTNQKGLQVKVRGEAYVIDENGDESMEVSTNPATFSVLYLCKFDGTAEVSLTLTKAPVRPTDGTDSFRLNWKKHCGEVKFAQLQIALKPEQGDNKTVAVRDGRVLPGFRRPCRGPAKVRTHETALSPDVADAEEECDDGPPALEFSYQENRIVLEVAAAGSTAVPTMSPPPDIAFDKRVLSATLIGFPSMVATGQRKEKTGSGGSGLLAPVGTITSF